MATTTLGALIAAVRTRRGMKQEDLADRLNVSRRTVGNWERNVTHPRLMLAKLGDELGVRFVEDSDGGWSAVEPPVVAGTVPITVNDERGEVTLYCHPGFWEGLDQTQRERILTDAWACILRGRRDMLRP